MGEILSLHCTCGYQAQGLTNGRGASGGPASEIVWCPHCRRHRSIRSDRAGRGCPRCGGPVAPFEFAWGEDRDMGVDFDARYACPRCGREELRLQLDLLWD